MDNENCRHECRRCRLRACATTGLSLLLVLLVAIPVYAQCGEPQAHFSPLAVTFFVDTNDFSASCTPLEMIVFSSDFETYLALTYYPCSGNVYLDDAGTSDDLPTFLRSACGLGWVNEYDPGDEDDDALALVRRRSTAAFQQVGGQASLPVAIADVNGDGYLDDVYMSSAGVVVQLRGSKGVLLSTKTFPAGFQPKTLSSHVVVADFNGDGKPDLAVSNVGNIGSDVGSMAILLGNGDGTFGAPQAVSAGSNPLSMAAADFNGDGKIDLAVANELPGAGGVSVLFGNGNGTFAAPVSYSVGEDFAGVPVSVLAVDFNGDGHPDLAVANRNDKSVSVLLNSGAGQFKPPSVIALPDDAQSLSFADLNHDGKIDLLIASQYSNPVGGFNDNAILVLTGNGDGSFQAPAVYGTANSPAAIAVAPLKDGNTVLAAADAISGGRWFTVVTPQNVVGAPAVVPVGGAPTGLAVADLTGAGQPDAVITGGTSDVTVLLSQNAQFSVKAGYSLNGANPQAVAIGDFNGDGKPDAITANSAGSVSVMLGNGDGTLRAAVNTAVNPKANRLAVGDFNGDGKLDTAVSDTSTGNVTILLGTGSGTFTVGATFTPVSGANPIAMAAADLNGDGVLDLAVVVSNSSTSVETLAVYLGKGGGAFQSAVLYPLQATAFAAGGIAIGDVNGDGKPDIVAAGDSSAKIDVLLGNGAGGFAEVSSLPTTTESGVDGLVLTDVNADGHLDLAVAHCCYLSDGTYLAGNGNGTFQAEQPFLSGSSPTGMAAAKFSGGNGLVTASQFGTMQAVVFVPPSAAAVAITADVSAANYSLATIAPDSFASAFGTNLATQTAQPSSGTLPTSLAGTTVTIVDAAGVSHAGLISYVSSGLVNFVVPDGTALGTATVTIASGSGLSASIQTPVASIAPGIFPLNATGLVAAIVLVVGANNAQTFGNVYQVNSSGGIVPLPVDLSTGQAYLELYGTGVRNGKSVTVTIGGTNIPVLSSGAQGTTPGLDQINVGPLPVSLMGAGQVNVVVSVDGQAANTTNITLR